MTRRYLLADRRNGRNKTPVMSVDMQVTKGKVSFSKSIVIEWGCQLNRCE